MRQKPGFYISSDLVKNVATKHGTHWSRLAGRRPVWARELAEHAVSIGVFCAHGLKDVLIFDEHSALADGSHPEFSMKYILLVLAGLTVIIVVIAGQIGIGPFSRWTSSSPSLTSKIYFLRDVDIRDEDHPVLVLHEPAAGGEMRAVDDPVVLRARSQDSYFSIDPDPVRSPLSHSHIANGYFVSLFRDGHPVRRWTCVALFCSTSDSLGVAPEASSLQPLLDASHPVDRVFETYESRDAQLAAADAARDDPTVIAGSVDDRDPYLGAPDFGGSFQVALPALFISRDKTEAERLQIATAEVDRMTKRLFDLLDGTERRWKSTDEPDIKRIQSPLLRHLHNGDLTGRPFVSGDGERIMMETHEIFVPVVHISGPKELADTLASVIAAEIHSPLALDDQVQQTIDRAVEKATDAECESCWSFDAQYRITQTPRVEYFQAPIYPLVYLHIVDQG